ncbi:MAG TPA: pitrilysin family protein [Nitrososphaerales archaeon]|nr:pitrilysin family protein [Nitrososphaerales archaeon]
MAANILNHSFKLLEGIQEFTLENGLQVLLKSVPTSSAVSTWIFYKVGSRNEQLGTTGASHWCEHMLFKGGGKLGKGDVHTLVSSEGGRNNAFTDHDVTAYFETLPKDRLDLGLYIESERMANAAFDPGEVESERQVIISEREGSENFPQYLLREEIYSVAYHQHPYMWPVIGWKNDLKHMTREDLYHHYRLFYHPNNSILVVTGNFDASKASTEIRRLFSEIPAGERIPSRIPFRELPQKGERLVKLRQPGTLNYLAVAFHVPEITHEDAPALIVLSALLGGWRGLIGFFGDRFVPKTNRLYKRLVEGNLASEVNTSFPVNIDPCLLYFDVTLNPAVRMETAREAILSEMERAADVPPSETEMKVTSNQIRAWHAYENDGIGLQALSIGYLERIQSRALAETLIEKALRVTPEQVQKVAKRYLSDTNRIVGEYNSITGDETNR